MKYTYDLPVYEEDDICSLDEYSELMAQKVHSKIENNKYNDANIKKDIEDIKEEQIQQNKNIENLQTNDNKQDELISKLKNAALNAETEESKSIHVEDANKFGQLEVLGSQGQETREGYNKYDYLKNLVDSIAGLTVTKDDEGYVIVNGTPEYNYAVLSTLVDITDNLEDGQTYTMWAENHYGNNDAGIYLQVRITKISDGTVQYLTTGNVNRTFTVDKSLYTYKANIQTGTIALSGTFNNSKNRFMIYKGTEEKEYEQYGASPSPNYPSEVKCLGSNKNIYDDSTSATNQRLSTSTGGTYAQTGYSVSGYIEILPNQYLIINTDYDSYYCFYNTEKQYVSGDSFKNTKRIKSSSNVKYIKFDFRTEDREKIKVEYGTEATSYSPYNQGSTKISKINKNIYDIAKYPFINRIAYNSSGGQVFWDGYCGVLDYFPVKENTQYTFSNNLGQSFTYGLVFYNKDKEVISVETTHPATFTTPKSCKYIRFAIYSDTLPTWVQIEVGNTATSNIEHEQTDYLLYIQQEMLSRDYFIKEDDGWKEVHNWNKVILDETKNYSLASNNRYIFVTTLAAVNEMYQINCICDKLTSTSLSTMVSSTEVNLVAVNESNINIKPNNEITTVEQFKDWIQENNITVYYKLATPTKITCTPEQTAVLEELSNLELFDGVNNIITAEDISLLKLKYALDVETYIDNKLNTINQQILEIAGGN